MYMYDNGSQKYFAQPVFHACSTIVNHLVLVLAQFNSIQF